MSSRHSSSIDLNYTSKWSQERTKVQWKSIINKDGSSGRSIISLKTKMAIISDSLSSIDVSLFEICSSKYHPKMAWNVHNWHLGKIDEVVNFSLPSCKMRISSKLGKNIICAVKTNCRRANVQSCERLILKKSSYSKGQNPLLTVLLNWKMHLGKKQLLSYN